MNITAEQLNALIEAGASMDAAVNNAAQGDPWSAVSGTVIGRFLDFIWMRHGLSQPTLHAYRADLHSMDRWLLQVKHRTVIQATAEDVREFLMVRGQHSRSTHEPMPSLSCIKRFYCFLLGSGFRSDDPTETVFVRAPRLVRHDLAVIRSASAAQ